MKMKFEDEPIVKELNKVIHLLVRILAVLMTFVIFWSVVNVVVLLYRQLVTSPFHLLNLSDILPIFGAFMIVLIAIELFVNITVYLREDVIHVKIVIATALMAIARKVIIFDFEKLTPFHLLGLSTIIFALSISYWLIGPEKKEKKSE